MVYSSPKFLKLPLVRPKKQLQSFSDCKACWSKNCNGKLTTILFCNVYYECIERKLGICLILVMSVDDDWMVNLMIISTEKTIAKALDINDIIKKKTGMSAR
jgi:hypothetical protein